MKLYNFLIIVLTISLFVSGCGGAAEKQTDAETTTPKDSVEAEVVFTPSIPEGFVEKSLDEVGMKAIIMCPAEAYIYTSTLLNNEGEQEQIIVQFDSNSDIKLCISTTKLDMDAVKKEIQSDLFLKFKKFLLDDGSGIVYEVENNSNGKTLYHFVFLIKNGDITYRIDSDNFKEYTLEQISTLYAMAQSVSLL